MSTWDEVLAAALVGTERQAPRLPPGGTPLGDSLAPLEGREREAMLLGMAAAMALYRRVGQRPARDDQPVPAAAEPDGEGVCSLRSAQHLEVILASRKPVLPEWLRSAAERGKRVPDHVLPELLDAGRQQRELREQILPALGRRGRWLATQNRDWNYLAGEEEESSWETGTRAARQMLLSRMRATDPGRARELLAESWSSEPADDRNAFLSTFRTRLSMEDEPFLESALDDRSKGVRQTAADLLARLPESRLVGRMLERVRALVSVRSAGLPLGIGKKARIDISLPAECDKATERDGVEAKLPQYERRFGQKAWWMVQMLTAIPPSVWCEMGDASPGELLAAVGKGEWKKALMEAWLTATERHRDVDWAEALLLTEGIANSHGEQLVDILPPERREALVLKLIEQDGGLLRGDQPAAQVLSACQHPWSERLSRAVLDGLRKRISHPPNRNAYDYQLNYQLSQFGLYLSPAVLDQAETGWPTGEKHWTYWESTIQEFTALLQFRREMLEEIQR